MSVWDSYQNRISAHGGTKRGAAYQREVRFLETKLPDNLSYHIAEIYPAAYGYNLEDTEAQSNKIVQQVAILNSDNLDEKLILSLPGEDIALGALVGWMGTYYLVTERDANQTLYTKAKMVQCNHLLKWVSSGGQIMRQWCIVADGTKYLTGEVEDKSFATTRGDSRISIQIAKNTHTVAFDRERRFLVDDPDAPHKIAYQLTKPLKKGSTYGGQGTFKFVMQEVTATENDNHMLGIADYYLYFPKKMEVAAGSASGKKVWI